MEESSINLLFSTIIIIGNGFIYYFKAFKCVVLIKISLSGAFFAGLCLHIYIREIIEIIPGDLRRLVVAQTPLRRES